MDIDAIKKFRATEQFYGFYRIENGWYIPVNQYKCPLGYGVDEILYMSKGEEDALFKSRAIKFSKSQTWNKVLLFNVRPDGHLFVHEENDNLEKSDLIEYFRRLELLYALWEEAKYNGKWQNIMGRIKTKLKSICKILEFRKREEPFSIFYSD